MRSRSTAVDPARKPERMKGGRVRLTLPAAARKLFITTSYFRNWRRAWTGGSIGSRLLAQSRGTKSKHNQHGRSAAISTGTPPRRCGTRRGRRWRRRLRFPAIRLRCMPKAAPRAGWSRHAREQVAALVGARPGDVFFTSSGTEANMLALTPAIESAGDKRPRATASGLGDRACLGARRRPVCPRGDRGHCRSMRDGPARSRGVARDAVAKIAAAAGVADARQQRNRRHCSRSRRRQRSCMRPAACCMSMRCRRPGRSLAISLRLAPIC